VDPVPVITPLDIAQVPDSIVHDGSAPFPPEKLSLNSTVPPLPAGSTVKVALWLLPE
jgi:hypothetical protein